jgi:putative ATP-dependent endonuclease of the OLD family
MYLKQLDIQGYKNFHSPFSINFTNALNVIVGENGSGKSAIIDAIRQLLLEDEFGRSSVQDTDFNRPFSKPNENAKSFRIQGQFDGMSQEQKVAFLPWMNPSGQASLSLLANNKQDHYGRYKRTLWGGPSRSSMFERELFEAINCIYLPPLRDALSKLQEGRGSRLARLLRNLNKKKLDEAKQKNKPHDLEQKVMDFNEKLAKSETINVANDLIRKRLQDALGSVFGQDTNIRFSEIRFNRIVENLKLLFFPRVNSGVSSDHFRSLEENSLGYNNLLYLATVLAEVSDIDLEAEEPEFLKVLLIEEPEAHLHPQLQIILLKYLEKTSKEKGVQIIVTTHSPVLASSVSLDSVTHLSALGHEPNAVLLSSCGLSGDAAAFVNRWLDVTKSTLLFARGVILVEGIAESMLLPELAKLCLKKHNAALVGDNPVRLPESLDEGGIAIINMNGIYFKYFMQFFANIDDAIGQNVPIKCAGITDNDPPKDSMPTPAKPVEGNNPALRLLDSINISDWARLYANKLKTFEYDLAMEADNLKVLVPVAKSLLTTNGPIKNKYEGYEKINWSAATDDQKAEASLYLLNHIEDIKGEFSQAVASEVASQGQTLKVPEYIREAVIWVCEGASNEIHGEAEASGE